MVGVWGHSGGDAGERPVGLWPGRAVVLWVLLVRLFFCGSVARQGGIAALITRLVGRSSLRLMMFASQRLYGACSAGLRARRGPPLSSLFCLSTCIVAGRPVSTTGTFLAGPPTLLPCGPRHPFCVGQGPRRFAVFAGRLFLVGPPLGPRRPGRPARWVPRPRPAQSLNLANVGYGCRQGVLPMWPWCRGRYRGATLEPSGPVAAATSADARRAPDAGRDRRWAIVGHAAELGSVIFWQPAPGPRHSFWGRQRLPLIFVFLCLCFALPYSFCLSAWAETLSGPVPPPAVRPTFRP